MCFMVRRNDLCAEPLPTQVGAEGEHMLVSYSVYEYE